MRALQRYFRPIYDSYASIFEGFALTLSRTDALDERAPSTARRGAHRGIGHGACRIADGLAADQFQWVTA